jgi:hypothetical protein
MLLVASVSIGVRRGYLALQSCTAFDFLRTHGPEEIKQLWKESYSKLRSNPLNRAIDGDRIHFVEASSHLFDGADNQLVSWLGLRGIDGMDGKLKNAGSLSFYGRDAESGEVLDDVDDLVGFVHVDQIQRKENADGMNSTGGQNPEPFIDPEPELTDQASETGEGVIGRKNAEAQEALPRLVVHAISSSLHISDRAHGYPFLVCLTCRQITLTMHFLSLMSRQKILSRVLLWS